MPHHGQECPREARRLNLVTVQERRRRGQKSLTNLVRIVSPEWTDWIRIGGKKLTTPDKGQKERGFGTTWERYYRNYKPDSDAPSRREAISKRKKEATDSAISPLRRSPGNGAARVFFASKSESGHDISISDRARSRHRGSTPATRGAAGEMAARISGPASRRSPAGGAADGRAAGGPGRARGGPMMWWCRCGSRLRAAAAGPNGP
jgi:hypothetical protein